MSYMISTPMVEDSLSLTQLETDVRTALKLWHVDSSRGSPIDYLRSYEALRRNGSSVREATNQVLYDALKALEEEDPGSSTLLRWRYLDGRSALQVANALNVGESTLYPQQRKAFSALAQLIYHDEMRARLRSKLSVDALLGPPSHVDLVGLEGPLHQLFPLLASPGQPRILAVVGIGGIGKTTLADALVRKASREANFHNVAWVTAQRSHMSDPVATILPSENVALTPVEIIDSLVSQLIKDDPLVQQRASREKLAVLQHVLKEQPHLIVIDNLENVADADSALAIVRSLGPLAKVILTSRSSLYEESDIYHYAVAELTIADALMLVRLEARLRNLPLLAEATDDELSAIYEAVGGNPLALKLVVGQTYVHGLTMVLEDLTSARGKRVEQLYEYIYSRAWNSLDEPARNVLLAMPLLPAAGGSLEQLTAIAAITPSEIREALQVLVTMNLVDVKGELMRRRYTIHQLTRTFLMEQVARWK